MRETYPHRGCLSRTGHCGRRHTANPGGRSQTHRGSTRNREGLSRRSTKSGKLSEGSPRMQVLELLKKAEGQAVAQVETPSMTRGGVSLQEVQLI